MTDLNTINQRIDSYRQDLIDLETGLTAIVAMSPKSGGDGEQKKAEFIKDYLNKHGITQIEEIHGVDPDVSCGYRPNLIATIPGKDHSKAVWLMAHMDVVPPGDLAKWDTDPWKAVVKGDKIYGRGVEDDQQGLCAAVLAARAFIDEGVTPPVDIKLLLVADEETGNELGIGEIMKNAPFGKDDYIVVPDGGVSDGTQVEVAEMSILWLKITTRGVQCHASMPHKGANAMKGGARIAVALDELYKIFDARNDVFDPPYSTFEPTKKENNVPNINTIPGEDVFYVDCRVMPNYKLDDVIAKATAIAEKVAKESGVSVTVEVAQRSDAAPPTPVDAPVVTGIIKAIKDVYGVNPIAQGIGGGTVAAHIRKEGYNAVVWCKQDETMHGPNEYAILSNILGDAKVFAHLIWNA